MGDPVSERGSADERGPQAPHFRLWPPVAVGVPWLLGVWMEGALGQLLVVDGVGRVLGWLLIAFFGVWNGWCLLLFSRRRTGLLPGQPTTTLLESGPYRLSRNPLYVGLLALYVGSALVVSSLLALALTPLAWAGLHWGAVLPEEAYLTRTLGADYVSYRSRVRRWL